MHIRVEKTRILNVDFYIFEYKNQRSNKIHRIQFDSFRLYSFSVKDDLIQLLYLGKYVLSIHKDYSPDYFKFLREYLDEHKI